MRKIKTAIVGMGRIGRMGHAEELLKRLDKFEIIAVADNAPDRLENLPEGLENVRKYSALQDVLGDRDIEMVTIGVRHADHVPMALEIMAAGKIAVVEKPVATSVKEMDILLKAAEKHPGKLFFRHSVSAYRPVPR